MRSIRRLPAGNAVFHVSSGERTAAPPDPIARLVCLRRAIDSMSDPSMRGVSDEL
jgi:hypothetical protein